MRVEASKNRLIWVRPRKDAALLLDLPRDFDGFLGHIEQGDNVARRKPFDAEQVPVRKGGRGRSDHR